MFFYLYIDNGLHSFALGGLEANLAIIGQKVEHPLGKSPVCFSFSALSIKHGQY